MTPSTQNKPTRSSTNQQRERSPTRSTTGTHNIYRERSRDRDNVSEESNERGRTFIREADKHSTPVKRNDVDSDIKKADSEGRMGNINSSAQETDMMALMGFASFDTTKNKHVEGVGSGSVKKNKKAKFRQYMNREKGFNRALSPDKRKR